MKTKQPIQRFLIALFVITGLALLAGNMSPAPVNSHTQTAERFLGGRGFTISATTAPEYKYVPVRRY